MNERTKQAMVNELEKIAITAAARQIAKLLRVGTPEAIQSAKNIAKVVPGRGSGVMISHLGRGSEGLADVVIHPKHGLSVRKLYNPTSAIASPKMIGRKMQFAKEVQHPQLAKTLGFERTGLGGRMSFHEYVPGGQAAGAASKVKAPARVPTVVGGTPSTVPSSASESSKIRQSIQQQAGTKGWDPQDIRSGNIVGGKAIDILPFRKGEVRFPTTTEAGAAIGPTPHAREQLMGHQMRRAGPTAGPSSYAPYKLLGTAKKMQPGVARPVT